MVSKTIHTTIEQYVYVWKFRRPIISRDTMQIFEHPREVNPRMKLSMHTNGSAREQNWWKELAKYRVIVTFGIDGLEDTHSI